MRKLRDFCPVLPLWWEPCWERYITFFQSSLWPLCLWMICGRALGFIYGIDIHLVYLSSENANYIYTHEYMLILSYREDMLNEKKKRVGLERGSGMEMPLLTNSEQETYIKKKKKERLYCVCLSHFARNPSY